MAVKLKGLRILVTGGAGFMGSHLVERLMKENEVVVYDDYSNAVVEEEWEGVEYVRGDVLDLSKLEESLRGVDLVFHFAASGSVKESSEDPLGTFRRNVVGTLNVLEAARRNDVGRIVFASSSTVYGEAEVIPTPEDAPLRPISNYGASKAACEMYLRSYSSTYGIKAIVLRYANVFGPRSNHGVVHDFCLKLTRDPTRLQILGDGKQRKSYLYIDDAIDATLCSLSSSKDFDVFNVGSEEQVTVDEIARMVSSEMGLNPVFEYTGGRRGWPGDVTEMLLDIRKIKSLGWAPKVSIREGIRRYVRWFKSAYGSTSCGRG